MVNLNKVKKKASTILQGLKAALLPGRALFLFCFSVFFCFCANVQPGYGQIQDLPVTTEARYFIGLQLPNVTSAGATPVMNSLDPRVFPFEQTPNLGLSLHGALTPFLRWQPLSLQRKAEIDSTGNFIIVQEKVNGLPLRLPYYVTLNDYLNNRLSYDRQVYWRQAAAENIFKTGDEERRGPGGVNIDIPVPIKSKAFQQIFGGSTVGLNVQGDIRIDGGFRTEDRSETQGAFTRGSNFSFKMNQTQRFTVTGRVGEKVTVNIDQDSERAFDFENNIKLNYTGFDDDIVKKIEAGNIALSLPGTRFVTFGGTSAGLFGIKSEMQLGDLAITAIASQEKGENKKLTLSGGATEGLQRIQDYDYRRYTYFFLDRFYRDQFRTYIDKWVHVYDRQFAIERIEVYKSQAGYDVKPEAIPGVAYRNPNPEANPDTSEIYRGHFIRLEPSTDYYIEKTLGYIIMTNPLNTEEVLAVAYRDSSGNTVGDINYVADPDPTKRQPIRLRLIKPRSPTPSRDPMHTWHLEWKNVYFLGSRNIPQEEFQLKIFYKPPSGVPEEILTDPQGGAPISYLRIFGLDERDNTGTSRPDNVVDNDPALLNLARGELIFPDLRPFDPVGVDVANPPPSLPIDKRTPAIYDTSVQAVIYRESKFYIEVKSKNRSSNYNLGFNVIEGSEEVLLNGRRLTRDQDYVIDYFSGNLTLLSPEATTPNANVEVSYQSNQLFQLEKKTILGTRAEYRFSPNSFIGGTLLYLNERTLDRRVRLGSIDKGPMQNFIWDVNTALHFQPNFLSRALNALPFLSTQEPSDLRIEGEIAQIVPNPNTLNSEISGDAAGVAYVDDFEASKRTTPFGVNRRSWVQASIPVQILNQDSLVNHTDAFGLLRERKALARRGRLIWANPFSGVPITTVWKNRDVNANVAQTTQVLEMQFTPADTVSVVGGKSLNPWGGIMRALSPGFFDQTEAKFLEVTMRVVSADSTGKMHIELGQISEDIIPNGGTQPNTEDFQGGQRNGILDDNEDVGLDGVRGNDSAPNFSLDGNGRDFWDVNRNRQHDWGEPASDDDWAYVSGSNDFRFINGTENSRNEEGGPRPDTEDINGNGGLDLSNKYFSYLIELDPTKPNKDKSATNPETGWFLYRLPLNEIETTIKQGGDPSFTLIEYVRIWVEGKKPIFLQIADISMVSNEWKEIGIGEAEVDLSGYKKDPRFEVSIINTEENPGEYQSPPGVQREEDLITKVLAKEQSQVLRVTNVGKDSIVVAQKTFFQPLNLINYNDLKMFVYGRDDGSHMQFANHPDSSAIEFFIRFGADERNFYEFRERVFRGWDERNEMDVDLIELTSLKPPLSRNDGLVPGLQDTTYYYKKISNKKGTRTQELRIRGIPSLTNVRTLIAGVKNLSSTPFSGEIWMDELRVAGVKKDKGMAMRVRADLKLADFMTINGELNRQDADFHNVSERFGRGDNRLSFTLSGNMTFDKMLPESWGLNVPLSMNYTKSEATPKYFPGRDIQVTNDLKPHELEQIQSLNNQFGFNFSVRRRAKSQNFFLKNTIDNLSGSLSYTKNSLSNSQIKHSNRVAWSGDLGYNLSFGQKNFIKPFAWIGKAPIVGKLTDTKLYYLPQNFDTRLQATDSKDSSETRVIDSRTGLTTRGVRSKTRSYTSVLTYRTSMKLVESMSLDFSRSFTNDMLSKARRDPKLRAQGIFGLLTGNYDNVNANQSFSTRYSPNVLSWLNTNFNYTSNFRYTNNIQQRVIGRSAGTNASFTASATLRFSQLFQSLKSRGPSSSGETSGRTRQAPRLPPGDQPRTEEGEEDVPVKPPEGQPSQERKPPGEPSKEKQEPKKPAPKREEGKSGRSISLLDFFGKFKDISFNFSRRKNYSNNALDSTGTPSLAYQFGLTRDPGVPTVSNITTTPSVFQRVDNYSVQTGFDISRSFNVQLRFDHDEQSNVSTTKTGSTSDSWLGSKEYRIPFLPQEGIPFPEWTITWSGLERLKPFNKIATSMSISHSFGGKKSKIWNGTPDQKTSEDFSFNFKPLLKVNLSWKNGMISSFQYNKTTGEKPTYSPLDPNIEQSNSFTRNTDISLTTTYSKRSGFRVPLPFLKNKELKNSIDLSITFLKGSSKSSLQRGQGSEKISANETERWSFSPRMTYSFSNRVRGGVNFEYGKTKSKLSGTTTIKELGIDINISIRGD